MHCQPKWQNWKAEDTIGKSSYNYCKIIFSDFGKNNRKNSETKFSFYLLFLYFLLLLFFLLLIFSYTICYFVIISIISLYRCQYCKSLPAQILVLYTKVWLTNLQQVWARLDVHKKGVHDERKGTGAAVSILWWS